jgi:hypothetical protein
VTERGLLFVLANAVEGKEAEFNDWYDNVHVPDMLSVPGILTCTRARFSDVEFLPGSRVEDYRYVTIYDVEAGDDEGFERIAENLRAAFFGGANVQASQLKSEGVTTEAMPISDALDLTSVKDTFATVLLRKNT